MNILYIYFYNSLNIFDFVDFFLNLVISVRHPWIIYMSTEKKYEETTENVGQLGDLLRKRM